MINKQLYDFINELSDRDTKTLVGKGLKLAEEAGELASKLLPYENASGTKHRFVTRDALMEEVADVMLVALSIARQLEMNEDDLNYYLDKKSIYWSELQSGEMKEDIASNRIPFELHVSVIPSGTSEDFKKKCAAIGTKGIVLELYNSKGEVFQDWMTSSRLIGDNKSILEEAKRLERELTTLSYEVIRVKIETVPWHPSAPKTFGAAKGLRDYYFEAHMGVVIKNDLDLGIASAACKTYSAYNKDVKVNISGNASKVFSDGSRIYMITLRSYNTYTIKFKDMVKTLKDYLKDMHIPTNHEVIEYAIYDTNVAHDNRWLDE